MIYDLGNKQWDIPKLRDLLETIMLLNARQIERVSGQARIILLAIEDITARREIENGLEKAHILF